MSIIFFKGILKINKYSLNSSCAYQSTFISTHILHTNNHSPYQQFVKYFIK